MWFVKVNESRQIEFIQSDWIPRFHIEHTVTHDKTILTRTFLTKMYNPRRIPYNRAVIARMEGIDNDDISRFLIPSACPNDANILAPIAATEKPYPTLNE